MLNLIKNQNPEIEVLLKRAVLFAEDGTVIETGFDGHYNVRYNSKLPTLK